jgi:hypothetical protein
MPPFIAGLELSRRFYTEVVRGLVKPPHAACLLGEGSEVLGYDQPRSTDHAWGPRLQIFVAAPEVEAVEDAIAQALPARFQGWPVRFFKLQTGTVTHHVEVTTLENWLHAQLGFDPRLELTTASWLALSQQCLLQVTAGAVFHDDTGDLTSVRRLLGWYPRDVWLWLLASQWHLIGNAEPLIGRTREAADARGSALVAATLVRLMMQLSFLQERRYWPYPKWFGTAFSRLDAAPMLGPLLDAALAAREHADREEALAPRPRVPGAAAQRAWLNACRRRFDRTLPRQHQRCGPAVSRPQRGQVRHGLPGCNRGRTSAQAGTGRSVGPAHARR